MEFSHDRLLNWLAHYGVPLYQAHASGHATPYELKRAIKEINPKKVYPIHTKRPELFKKFMSDIGNRNQTASRRGNLQTLNISVINQPFFLYPSVRPD